MKQRQAASGAPARTLRLPCVVFVTVLAGAPVLIAPGLCFYFDITPKVVLLLCGAALACWMPRAWLDGMRILSRESLGRLWLAVLAAGLLSLLLSTMFSAQPSLSFAGSNWRRFGVVTHSAVLLFVAFFAAWLMTHRDRLVILLRVLTVAGAATAIYGIFQYFGIDPWLDPESYHIGSGEWAIVRTPGTLGHAGYFATYLLAEIFWALGLARMESQRFWRAFAVAAAALGSLAVVLSGTRGAILGLLAGGLLAALWSRQRWNRGVLAAVVLAAVGLAVFYYSPPGQKLRSRTRWYVEDSSGGGRPTLWRDSLRMFSAGPWWTGTGLETYGAAFPRFLSPELARSYPNRYYESAHNIFLDALTSQGLPGLLSLAGMTALALAAAWRLRKADAGPDRWIAAAFLASLCSNQFLAFTAVTALYFYSSVALLVVLSIREAPAAVEQPPPRWAGAAAAATGAVFAVFAAQLAAADLLLPRVRREAEAGHVAQAVAGYQQVCRLEPWGMNVDLWFSRLMLTASQKTSDPAEISSAWSSALQAAERAAHQGDELQAACYNLAVIHGLRNDALQAESALRRTIAVAPVWYKPRWMLAQLLRATGRAEEALRESGRALELNGGKDPEVEATWNQLRSSSAQARPSEGTGTNQAAQKR